jgi:hypothetical protein
MKKSAIYLFAFLLIILLFGCKKDDESTPAQIFVSTPIANTPYQVFDTVKINLFVESKQDEVSLSISLLTSNYTPASPSSPLVFQHFKTGIETSLYFLLDNDKLASANYYLYFKVNDASGDAQLYRSIYIEGIPRKIEGFFIVSSLSDHQIGIEKFADDYTGLEMKLLPGNYAGSAISSFNKLVYTAGSNAGNFLAIDTDSLDIQWEIPIVPNPVQPYFTFLEEIDQVIYAGFYNGEVNGYSPAGNLIFSTQSDGLTFPTGVCIAGNMLVVSTISRSNLFENWLETYYLASGVANSKTNILARPIHLTALEDEKVLVFGNDSNTSIDTKLFDPGAGLVNSPYQPFPLPDELLICATNINPNLTLLGLESGIYLYNYQGSISLVADTFIPEILCWEDLSQTIWAAGGKEIRIFSANGQQVAQYTNTDSIFNLLLYYNK